PPGTRGPDVLDLDELTGDLFGYVEVDDESRWAAVADTYVCRRWWKSMREVMPAEADNSPPRLPSSPLPSLRSDCGTCTRPCDAKRTVRQAGPLLELLKVASSRIPHPNSATLVARQRTM